MRFDKILSGVIFAQFMGTKSLQFIIFNKDLKNSRSQLFIGTNFYKIQDPFIIPNFQKEKSSCCNFIYFSHFLQKLQNFYTKLSYSNGFYMSCGKKWQVSFMFLMSKLCQLSAGIFVLLSH